MSHRTSQADYYQENREFILIKRKEGLGYKG